MPNDIGQPWLKSTILSGTFQYEELPAQEEVAALPSPDARNALGLSDGPLLTVASGSSLESC